VEATAGAWDSSAVYRKGLRISPKANQGNLWEVAMWERNPSLRNMKKAINKGSDLYATRMYKDFIRGGQSYGPLSASVVKER
jgi:hypothetical protein